MVALNFNATSDPTLEAVDAAIEAAQSTDQRPYLGMSSLGDSCDRKLFYSFRWMTAVKFDAATLKRFDDGHRGEDLQADRLRMVKGITLHTVDRNTGNQFGFVACGGHVRGHMDGAIVGLLQAPKTWHVWEHKQVGEKNFKALLKLKETKDEKDVLQAWNKTYYAQAQLYMHFSGMTRHYLTCSTPGGRETTSVRTDANKQDAIALADRAERIVNAPAPLDGVSDDPDYFECRWCDYATLCHGSAAPLPTCRSCSHSTPEPGGTWTCARHQGKTLSVPEQKQGCQAHRVIPVLLRNWAEPVDASKQDNWVRYQLKSGGEFVNGLPPQGFTSDELHALVDKSALADPQVRELRAEFDGRLVA